MTAIGAVADDTGAMREQLGDRHLRHRLMEIADILPDRIVEPELAPLAQFHDARRREALGMRGDPETVARRQLDALREIGVTEGLFENDPAALRDGDDAAQLLRLAHLEFEPPGDIVERRRQPSVHLPSPHPR